MNAIDVVVPTVGRPSLRALLASLSRSRGPLPAAVFVVDDRRDRSAPLDLGAPSASLAARIRVLPGRAAGPASARNIGLRAASAPWIAFLDDDVVVGEDWLADLARDLEGLPDDVAGSQGNVRVPLPADRRPTDWERNTAGLERARWITADSAYRRDVLNALGGFDERFPRAYREDADLGLRVVATGRRIVRGSRRVSHPVRPADWTVSIRMQAGNADDALMDALHGRGWRERAGAPRGAFRAHAVTAAAGALAAAAGAVWLAGTARFAARRIAPGPRTPREVAAMLATSAAIPFAAVLHRVRGTVRARRLLRATSGPRTSRAAATARPRAILFDRDGTLVHDVPYNGDPARVVPVAGAREALARVRAHGIPTAIVSNQSGIALGRITAAQLDAVNARIDALLGPLGPFFHCTHAPDDGCRCRKPAPGLIERAARALGVTPQDCVVIGDIGADVEAAHAAGARAILVPTPVTRREEVLAAPCVAATLAEAIDLALHETAAGTRRAS